MHHGITVTPQTCKYTRFTFALFHLSENSLAQHSLCVEACDERDKDNTETQMVTKRQK